MFRVPPGRVGVLPNQYLKAAIDEGILHAGGFTILPRTFSPPAWT